MENTFGNINRQRLFNHIEELGKIGRREDGGIDRFSFTANEREAKQLVRRYMEEAGLTVREDGIGNLWGKREGRNPSAPAVISGSHIDTVPAGGAFDGALGVLAAIEALATMNENGIETDCPLEVASFTDEEGTRFGAGLLGSRAVTGRFNEEFLDYTDEQGVSMREAMEACGLSVENIGRARRDPQEVKAYVELHIEQGRVLERADSSVGIVTGIAGPLWKKYTITGIAGHAGATPMDMRNDPLPAAAELILFMRDAAAETGRAVATVGRIVAYPGGVNVIPERVEFTLDLRDIDAEARNSVEARIEGFCTEVARKYGVEIASEIMQDVPPVPCSKEIQDLTEEAVSGLGKQPLRLISGAGHDAMHFHEICPIGMIFVRSKDGISHNPAEWSSPEDCGDGAEVLYRVLLKLAQDSTSI